MKNLKDKIVFITGARGLGYAMARHLHRKALK